MTILQIDIILLKGDNRKMSLRVINKDWEPIP